MLLLVILFLGFWVLISNPICFLLTPSLYVGDFLSVKTSKELLKEVRKDTRYLFHFNFISGFRNHSVDVEILSESK